MGANMPINKVVAEPKNSVLFWVISVLLIVVGVYYIVNHNKRTADIPDVSKEFVVNAKKINAANNLVKRSYMGYVTPIHETLITPYISGYLEEILVEGGAEVKADDILVIIRQGEYQASLEAAKATLLQAQADYNNASLYYKRIKSAQKAVSKTEFDNAKAKFLSAQAAVSKAKADYDLAKINYEYTLIKAPISGVVGNVALTKGNYVSPNGDALFSIVQYNPIRVVFSITDKEYLEILQKNPSDLLKNEKIQIRLANGKIYSQTGKFKYMDNNLNKSTNSVAVYVDFENKNHELLPNAYVTVELDKYINNSVIIRQNMVTMREDGSFLNIIRDNKILEIPVNILDIENNNYYISNNFQKGDLLVLDKIGNLSKDTKIKVNIVSEERK